jgi:tetratricopeptide (TPR) repeat protein
LNSSWASDRATLAGDLTLHRRLLDSAVVHGDVRNPVQTLIRQMMQAVEEGRLHDADRFQQASFAVYRAQGVNATDFTAKSLSIEFAAAAGVASPQAVREYEQALDLETRTSKTAPALAAVRTYAKLGMAAKARSALATYERTVTDSNLRARNQGALPPIMIDLAIAERRYAEAAAMLRREDQKPDGPADNCGYCLPLALVRVFAMAGQADSALVQYDAYRRTPMGSRPRIGPDLTVPAPTMLALARIYDARGDARNAITAYRDYALRLERADAELQVNVREARARMQALSPVEPARR